MKFFSRRTVLPLLVSITLFFIYQIQAGSVSSGISKTPSQSVVIASTTPVAIVRPAKKTTGQYGLVKRVVDGDTIELETGEKVRYIGIDTPETKHPKKSVQCFGKEASAFNKQLVASQKVHLEKDVSNTDRYGRLLRYVYLLDGTFVNLVLVQDGYANVDTFPPDVKYSKVFVEAAREAREEGKGLWAKCR